MDIPKIDPSPYITAAYALGVGLMTTYTLWLFFDHRRLKALAEAIDISDGDAKHESK